MRPILVIFLLVCLLTSACQSGKTKSVQKKSVADTSKFYPIDLFIKEQIQYVDLRNFNLYKLTLTNGKKDSSALSKDQFIQWASIFLTKDISQPEIKSLFKEDIFHDVSTSSLTFNYTALSPATPIQNMAILLAEETNLVKRIFIKTVYTRGDTLITEQCNWKADKSFQVNRIYTTNTGYKQIELNTINWNDKP